MKKDKILFIAPGNPSFVKTDIKVLSERYKVCCQVTKWDKKWLTPFLLIYQVFFFLRNIWGAKFIIISFGGYWAFLPTLFGNILNIKVGVILHGTDAVSFQELNYGNLRKPLLRKVSGWVYKRADILLPVSQYLMKSENTFYSNKAVKLGLMHHFPDLDTPFEVIYNGLPVEKWNRQPQIEREKGTFITVVSELKMELKGIDLIVETSKKFPNNIFYIVGIDQFPGQYSVPDNVVCLGWQSGKELQELYNKCDYYLQLSSFEGFGVALCEAMLCGCIPIGSNVNLIPFIIGNTGYILQKRNTEELESLLRKVLNSTDNEIKRSQARQRIIDNFSISRRKKSLFEIIG